MREAAMACRWEFLLLGELPAVRAVNVKWSVI